MKAVRRFLFIASCAVWIVLFPLWIILFFPLAITYWIVTGVELDFERSTDCLFAWFKDFYKV